MADRVEDYWNISSIWRGRINNTNRLNVGQLINLLDSIKSRAGVVALRADELCNQIIRGKRNLKKAKPPNNLIRLHTKQQNEVSAMEVA
jgi:hypothetical protein